jgi:outer membrane protein
MYRHTLARDIRNAALGLFLVALAGLQVSLAADISVHLENPPSTGKVALVLFDSSNAFGDIRDPAKMVIYTLDGRDVYRVEGLPEGEYALMVYYDENDNGVMDKNFIGIPKEPMGFSNGYRPKGPPSYERAAFVLQEGVPAHFDVELFRPLGKLGQLGVGLGVLARSSPYRGSSGGVYQIIPAITYNGELLQIFGPRIQMSLLGDGNCRLAGTLVYRMGVYEVDDSDFLAGMGSPDDTAMIGLAVQSDLPYGMGLAASYSHDLLDRIGGGEARLGLDKSFQLAALRVSPGLSVNWMSADLANNDFGVSLDQANAARPVYELGSVVSIEAGVGMFIEVTTDCYFILNASVEFLDQDVVDSPIVELGHVFKGFGALSYVF